MHILLDSDLFFVFSASQLLEELANNFQVNLKDIFVPSEVKFKINSKNLRNLDFINKHNVFIKQYQKDFEHVSVIFGSECLNTNFYGQLIGFQDFDAGESLLITEAVFSENTVYLCSGDKKWMKRFPELPKDLKDKILEKLQNRVFCLESILLRLKEKIGLPNLHSKISKTVTISNHKTIKQISIDISNLETVCSSNFEDLKKNSDPRLFAEYE